jgi:beta-lactam-binding protein with PASTA domain
MGFFYFLGQKKFYINLLIALALAILLLWVAIKSLDVFTRHGEVYIVPDFSGQTIPQIVDQQYEEFFSLEVIDSVYDKKAEKGAVVMQHPLPGSRVKQGRHIYLTIVSESPEMTLVPNLKNLSLRQALVTLESFGLEAGTLDYVDYFARNAIVDQIVDNETVEPGTEVVRGTIIDLKVGLGKMVSKVNIPLLIAMKKDEAKKTLNYAYLNIGREYYLDGDDTAHARVYKTDPLPKEDILIGLGERVNVWYRSDEYFDFDNYLKQFVKDSLLLENILEQNITREK